MSGSVPIVTMVMSFAELLKFRFGKRAAHNEVKHNLHNVSVIFWPNSSSIPNFVVYVKIVPIFEAYYDRYVLSKVGIVVLFCIYCHLYMCFVILLEGGNKKSIYLCTQR